MTFLEPAWLYAAPGVVGLLLLLYFLKLKRQEVAVGSTYLWKSALQDLRVNAPLQRLRMNLLLLLQLLALAALLLALARPMSADQDAAGTDHLLLVDVSASMQATDGGPTTRLQRAVAAAREVVDELPFQDRGVVIAFSDEAAVKTDLTGSKGRLRDALAGLTPTERGTRLANALHRVRALLGRRERAATVTVFSDGRVGPLEGASLDADVPLRYVRIGGPAENLGIVAVDVQLAATRADPNRVFVTVKSASAAPTRVGVDLYLEGRLHRSRELALAPGQARAATFELPQLAAGAPFQRLELKLDRPLEGRDGNPADDVALAVLTPLQGSRVLLVTEGNLFLHAALQKDPLVQRPAGKLPVLSHQAFDEAVKRDDAALREYEVVVLDRCSPPALPPGGYLLFAGRPPFPGLDDAGQAEGARVVDWDETHPVGRFVSFGSLVLPTSRVLRRRESDKVIVDSTHGPLVLEARDAGRHAVVCAFDLLALPAEQAWTFDPSFPIFLTNAIRHLGRGEEATGKDLSVGTGATARLRRPPGATRAIVTPPGGQPFELSNLAQAERVHIPALDRAGIYAVGFQDAEGKEVATRHFAAHLRDEEEVALTPEERLVVEGRAVEGRAQADETQRELWKLLVLLCLGFVMLEWWVYNRRVYL